MSVVTRFAPSPTGMLHIGGARTALFNWLFSRHHAGQFLLRVEDTDRARSTGEAVEAIFAGLKWLGLDWDQEPFFQSRNLARHQALGRRLLAEGKAYRCYITPDELAEMRQKARAEGRPARYDRWRDRDPSEAPAGVAPAIRFRAPDQGETVIDDQVQGVVRFDVGQLDDMILLRGDGTPTYMLAMVADDHDMAVTHVIRGVDHLTNAARQAQLFMALGWEVPVFAHIPLIHGPDGAKLSKRHGALAAQAYQDQGFLPEAMRNYLARLGWSHGDDEIFSTDQMVEWFGLEAIGKSPARFDMDKLRSLNGTYIQQAKDSRLMKIMPVPPTAGTAPVFVKTIESLLPKLKKRAIEMESPPPTAGTAPVFVRVTEPVIPPSADKADVLVGRIELLMPELKQRAKTLLELSENATFLIAARPIQMIPKAAKLLKGDAPALLEKLLNQLKSLEKWTPEALEYSVKGFAESEGLKLGAVAQPLRAALTGSNASPGIFDVLAVLGREESLGRIADAARPA